MNKCLYCDSIIDDSVVYCDNSCMAAYMQRISLAVPIVAQETESQDDNWREVESILYDSEDLGFPTEKLKSTFFIQRRKQ